MYFHQPTLQSHVRGFPAKLVDVSNSTDRQGLQRASFSVWKYSMHM
jgi:hypothetical protein